MYRKVNWKRWIKRFTKVYEVGLSDNAKISAAGDRDMEDIIGDLHDTYIPQTIIRGLSEEQAELVRRIKALVVFENAYWASDGECDFGTTTIDGAWEVKWMLVDKLVKSILKED